MRLKGGPVVAVVILAPVAAVGAIVAWIGLALRDPGGRAMVAPAVGAGTGDTGGANAIGELIAGLDPDATERRARALREGEGLDPGGLATGFSLVAALPPREPPPGRVEVEFLVGRAVYRRTALGPIAPDRWGGDFPAGDVPTGASWRLIIDGVATVAAPVPLLDPGAVRGAIERGERPVVAVSVTE